MKIKFNKSSMWKLSILSLPIIIGVSHISGYLWCNRIRDKLEYARYIRDSLNDWINVTWYDDIENNSEAWKKKNRNAIFYRNIPISIKEFRDKFDNSKFEFKQSITFINIADYLNGTIEDGEWDISKEFYPFGWKIVTSEETTFGSVIIEGISPAKARILLLVRTNEGKDRTMGEMWIKIDY